MPSFTEIIGRILQVTSATAACSVVLGTLLVNYFAKVHHQGIVPYTSSGSVIYLIAMLSGCVSVVLPPSTLCPGSFFGKGDESILCPIDIQK